MNVKETRAALARHKEEAAAQVGAVEAASSRELADQRERLDALRHVNSALEGRLRALFDSRLKESGKASTLQEAVSMLTDEYVVVVDSLKATQESLAAEQRLAASLNEALVRRLSFEPEPPPEIGRRCAAAV